MRKPVVRALIVILALTLVVWGFSYFIQPILPSEANNILYFFSLALVTAISLLSGFPDIVERLSGKRKPELDKLQKLRNRNKMLQLMNNTWVEGVLKKSLYNEILIDLGIESKSDAIDYPWEVVIQIPDKVSRKVASGKKILEIFDQTSGSLLILGEPGSGKTTMLLELARQKILRAQNNPNEPIPVVFNLSSWTIKSTIVDWLVKELLDNYQIPLKLGRLWVENDDLLLLLDGLDEVRADYREACVQAINAFRAEHNTELAICSRREEYEALEGKLKLRGAVLIQLLSPEQIDSYLQKAGRGLKHIQQLLKKDLTLLNFAQTPLVLSIIVMAYRYSSPETIKSLEMATNRHRQLFDVYIQEMFRRKGSLSRYAPKKAKGWLAWLARQMVMNGESQFNIEDIRLNLFWLYNRKIRLLFPLGSGLIVGMTVGLRFGLLGWLIGGLLGGLVVGLLVELIEARPTEELIWSWKRAQSGLAFGLTLGLIAGVIVGLFAGPSYGLRVGLSIALIAGLIVGLALGLGGSLIEKGSKPGSGIQVSTNETLIVGLSFGLFVGLAVGLIFEPGFGLSFGLFFGLIVGLSEGFLGLGVERRNVPGAVIETSIKNSLVVGLSFGLSFGLILGLFVSQGFGLILGLIVWLSFGLAVGLIFGLSYGGIFVLSHLTARFLIYRSGDIPWDLISFLDYAAHLIFLRRVGGGYIFIHRMLMEHFAAMAPGNEESE